MASKKKTPAQIELEKERRAFVQARPNLEKPEARKRFYVQKRAAELEAAGKPVDRKALRQKFETGGVQRAGFYTQADLQRIAAAKNNNGGTTKKKNTVQSKNVGDAKDRRVGGVSAPGSAGGVSFRATSAPTGVTGRVAGANIENGVSRMKAPPGYKYQPAPGLKTKDQPLVRDYTRGEQAKAAAGFFAELSGIPTVARFVKNPTKRGAIETGLVAASYIPIIGKGIKYAGMAKLGSIAAKSKPITILGDITTVETSAATVVGAVKKGQTVVTKTPMSGTAAGLRGRAGSLRGKSGSLRGKSGPLRGPASAAKANTRGAKLRAANNAAAATKASRVTTAAEKASTATKATTAKKAATATKNVAKTAKKTKKTTAATVAQPVAKPVAQPVVAATKTTTKAATKTTTKTATKASTKAATKTTTKATAKATAKAADKGPGMIYDGPRMNANFLETTSRASGSNMEMLSADVLNNLAKAQGQAMSQVVAKVNTGAKTAGSVAKKTKAGKVTKAEAKKAYDVVIGGQARNVRPVAEAVFKSKKELDKWVRSGGKELLKRASEQERQAWRAKNARVLKEVESAAAEAQKARAAANARTNARLARYNRARQPLKDLYNRAALNRANRQADTVGMPRSTAGKKK